ncbi:hypothetical protein AB0H73_37975 [Streptomyces olivoreticuli]
MQLRQIHPVPDLGLGIRLDLEGRARFCHEGFVVDVHVRRVTEDDGVWYCGDETGPNDVLVIGTISECGVELVRVESPGDFGHPRELREAVEQVLRDAVEGARGTVAGLVARFADIDRRNRPGTA